MKLDIKKLITEIVREELDMDRPEGNESMKKIHRKIMEAEMNDFSRAYIEAALWSETDNSDPSGGESLDKNYTFADIEETTFAQMIADCKDFQKKYKELYEQGEWTDEQAGHDFWLTRTGSGTGFWDRGYGNPEKEKVGRLLTKASRTYGSYSLYIGDGAYDGLVVGGGG